MKKGNSKGLKSSATKKKIERIESLIQSTVFDWVTDREERDIGYAVPFLVKALSDKDEKVRNLAHRAIAIEMSEFDKKCVFEVMPSIIKILFNKKRDEIRRNAVLLLRDAVTGYFGSGRGYNISEDIPRLTELLTDSNESVKFGIADILTWYYANKRKEGKVIELLMHEDKDVRQEAAGTLDHMVLDIEPYIPHLVKLYSEKDKELRLRAATTVVGRSREFEDLSPTISLLIELSQDKRHLIKINTFQALGISVDKNINCSGKIPQKKWKIFEPVVQVMKNLLNDKEEGARNCAAHALGRYYVHKGEWKNFRSLLKHKNPTVRYGAMGEMQCDDGFFRDCKIDYSSLIPDLISMCFRDKNKKVRSAASRQIKHLVEMRKKYAKRVLEELKTSSLDIDRKSKETEQTREKLYKLIGEKYSRQFFNATLKATINQYLPIYRKIYAFQALCRYVEENVWCTTPEKWNIFKPVVQVMKNLLDDKEKGARECAGKTLGRYYAHKGEWKNFRSLLKHKSSAVRYGAIREMQCYNCNVDFSPLIPDLISMCVHDKSKDVRDKASLRIRDLIEMRKEYAKRVLKELKTSSLVIDGKSEETEQAREKLYKLIGEKYPRQFFKTTLKATINQYLPDYRKIYAFQALGRSVEKNIRCNKEKISQDIWKIFEPVVQVMKNLLNDNERGARECAGKTLGRYYAHKGEWENLRSLLKHKSLPVRDGAIREIRCFECEVDYSCLIPDLISMFLSFYDKNKDVPFSASWNLKLLILERKKYAKRVLQELKTSSPDIDRKSKRVKERRDILFKKAKETLKIKWIKG
jgi:HEAT repeat protein